MLLNIGDKIILLINTIYSKLYIIILLKIFLLKKIEINIYRF